MKTALVLSIFLLLLADNNIPILVFFGVVAFIAIVVTRVTRSRRDGSRHVRNGSRHVRNSYSNTTQVRRTFETEVRRVDGTRQTIIEERPLNDELLGLIKTQYPRDYERILKWIAKNPEDVKTILKNSEDYRKQIAEMARQARETQDWSDLK